MPLSAAALRRVATRSGSASSDPTSAQRQSRSVSVARAASRTSWPLAGWTVATQTSSPPADVADAEELPTGAGAGHRVGHVDARDRDVHPVRVQPVVPHEPPLGPAARH